MTIPSRRNDSPHWIPLILWLVADLLSLTGCSIVSPTAKEPQGQVAFVSTDGNLSLLDLVSGEIKPLTADERVHSPSWSPDGVHLAYLRETDSATHLDIVVLNVNTNTRSTISVLRESMLAAVVWSPDGRYLLGDVGCCPTGRKLILLDPANGQALRTIAYSYRYAWSPGDSQIALGRDELVNPPLPIGSGTTSSVVLLNLTSGVEQMLAPGRREAMYWPACWLSVKTLVYSQLLWERQQRTFWQVSIDDPSKSVELTAVSPDCDSTAWIKTLPAELQEGRGLLSWSPDKQWVVFSVTKDAQAKVYVVAISSLTPRQVSAGTEPVWRPVAR